MVERDSEIVEINGSDLRGEHKGGTGQLAWLLTTVAHSLCVQHQRSRGTFKALLAECCSLMVTV